MSLLLTVTAAVVESGSALPNPDPVQPPGTDGLISILAWAKWLALGACVLGIFIVGAMMALQHRRGEGGELLGKLAMPLAGAIVITAGVSLIGFLIT